MFRRGLSLECLESRLLLAGDVSVQPKGGWLVITGDDLDNQIEVERVDVGKYKITGLDNTQVNGNDDGEIQGITKGVKVDLKKGDDVFHLLGEVAGDLSVKMSDGNDVVEIGDDGAFPTARVTGKTTIDLGKGPGSVIVQQAEFGKNVQVKAANGELDEVAISASQTAVNGNLNVKTGKGGDHLTMMESTVTNGLTVNAGDGNNNVAAWQVDVTGTTSVKTGKGNDVIAIIELNALKDAKGKKGDVKLVSGNATSGDKVLFTNSSYTVEGNLSITTGNGADDVGIGHEGDIDTALNQFLEDQGWDTLGISSGPVQVGGKLTVTTGSGGDEAMIGGVTADGAVSINMGSGNDGCVIQDSTASKGVSVNMSSGDDELELYDNTVDGKLTLNGGAGFDELYQFNNIFDPLKASLKSFP